MRFTDFYRYGEQIPTHEQIQSRIKEINKLIIFMPNDEARNAMWRERDELMKMLED